MADTVVETGTYGTGVEPRMAIIVNLKVDNCILRLSGSVEIERALGNWLFA